MEVSKDSKMTLSIETLISLGTTLVLVVGMWFTLQADIKEAKELPEPPIGRTEYDLKDQMIRNTIKSFVGKNIEDHSLFTKRPEQLSVEDFIVLTNFLETLMK